MSLLEDLHALAFYLEVAKTNRVWTVRFTREAVEALAALTRAWPVWSCRDRAARAIGEGAGSTSLRLEEATTATFERDWIPQIAAMRWRILVNGERVGGVGNELEPTEFASTVAAAAKELRDLP